MVGTRSIDWLRTYDEILSRTHSAPLLELKTKYRRRQVCDTCCRCIYLVVVPLCVEIRGTFGYIISTASNAVIESACCFSDEDDTAID